MKVLFLGFSVTASSPGYYYVLKEQESKGELNFSVDFVALGGLHMHQLAYLLPELLKQKSADVVVLELLTSGARKLGDSNPNLYYELPLRSIIEFLILNDKKIVFLNLFRKDVNYKNDIMLDLFISLSCEYKLDLINVFDDFNRLEYPLEKYVWDYVHTTKKGAEYYAGRVADYFLENSFSSKKSTFSIGRLAKESFFNSIPLIVKENNCFLGKGFILPWQSLTVERELHFDFEEPTNSDMICFITGPTAAAISLFVNGSQVTSIRPFDAHSYYERVFVLPFKYNNIRKITFKLEDVVPSIKLIKGDWDRSCRQVKLVSLFIRKED